MDKGDRRTEREREEKLIPIQCAYSDKKTNSLRDRQTDRQRHK